MDRPTLGIEVNRTPRKDVPTAFDAAEPRASMLLLGRMYVVLGAAAVATACALATGSPATKACPIRSAFLEPVRVERLSVESPEAVRLAESDIRVLFEENVDWVLTRTASEVDIVLRVDLDFWPAGKLTGVGGMVWTRAPASAEATLVSQSATTYDPNFGGPGPPPDFLRTLLSPLFTVEPDGCATTATGGWM